MIEKFNKIFDLVKSQDFLDGLSTGGEIPFYIITYDIKEENLLTESIDLLYKRLKNEGKKATIIDLHDKMIEALTEDDELEDYYDLEGDISTREFTQTIHLASNIDRTFIPNIAKTIDNEKPDLVLLKGVGRIYPFIRSHTIVNRLENIIKNIPIVLFYPGTYVGTQLSLFGRIKSENHYRAINIQDIQLYTKS